MSIHIQKCSKNSKLDYILETSVCIIVKLKNIKVKCLLLLRGDIRNNTGTFLITRDLFLHFVVIKISSILI